MVFLISFDLKDYLPCLTPRTGQQNVHNTNITNLRICLTTYNTKYIQNKQGIQLEVFFDRAS